MRIAFAAALMLLTASVARAATPLKVAVTGLNSVQVDRKVGDFVSEQLAIRLGELGVEVTSGRDIEAMLGLERQKQLLGCDENSACIAELGGALGVDFLLVGDVARVGARYQLTVKALSTGTGKTAAVFNEATTAEEEFVPLARRAAERLAADLSQATGKPLSAGMISNADSGGLRSKAWIPAVAGVVLLAGGVGAELVAFSRYNELNDGSRRSRAAADALSSSGKTLQTVFAVSATLGAAALAGAVAMYVAGGDSAQPTVMVTPDGASVGFVVRLP